MKRILIPVLLVLLYAVSGRQVQASSHTGTVTIAFEGMDDTFISVWKLKAEEIPKEGIDAAEAKKLAESRTGSPEYRVLIRNGRASLVNLPEGTYLLTGEAVTEEGRRITPLPTVFSTPNEGEGTFMVELKYTVTRLTHFRLVKQWHLDNVTVRPSEIRVSIFRDGIRQETVRLTNANGWQYEWDGETDHTWTVREEDVPKGYRCDIKEEGNVFAVHNTRKMVPYTADGGIFWEAVIFLSSAFTAALLVIWMAGQ